MADHEQGQVAVRVHPATLDALARRLRVTIVRREVVRVRQVSGVERLFLDDDSTAILKYAVYEFANEPRILGHAFRHGAPVPALWADRTQEDGSAVMVMEDLGTPTRAATLSDAAAAAVAVHTCPRPPYGPVLDSFGLAGLPSRALQWVDVLRAIDRWPDVKALRSDLGKLEKVALRRARGAEIPPYGMCHAEFCPTSVHVGEDDRLTIMDWARAYTGSGLLDLASWQGTAGPLDLHAVSDLIGMYVSAGGPPQALADRAGLPAHVWASGWGRLWAAEWLLENITRWANPENDAAAHATVSRCIGEAVECLS